MLSEEIEQQLKQLRGEKAFTSSIVNISVEKGWADDSFVKKELQYMALKFREIIELTKVDRCGELTKSEKRLLSILTKSGY